MGRGGRDRVRAGWTQNHCVTQDAYTSRRLGSTPNRGDDVGHANDGYEPSGVNDPVPPEAFPPEAADQAPEPEAVEAVEDVEEPEVADEPEAPVEDDEATRRYKELDALNVDDLKDRAKELDVSGYSSLKKDELIDAILAAEDAQVDEPEPAAAE